MSCFKGKQNIIPAITNVELSATSQAATKKLNPRVTPQTQNLGHNALLINLYIISLDNNNHQPHENFQIYPLRYSHTSIFRT